MLERVPYKIVNQTPSLYNIFFAVDYSGHRLRESAGHTDPQLLPVRDSPADREVAVSAGHQHDQLARRVAHEVVRRRLLHEHVPSYRSQCEPESGPGRPRRCRCPQWVELTELAQHKRLTWWSEFAKFRPTAAAAHSSLHICSPGHTCQHRTSVPPSDAPRGTSHLVAAPARVV